MTKKDFMLIAGVIAGVYEIHQGSEVEKKLLNNIILAFCDRLKDDNPQFQDDKFRELIYQRLDDRS